MSFDFDAIVVGSGITGGWAAKELCEAGLKTLVLERGRDVVHGGDEYTDSIEPWDQNNFGLVPEEFVRANPNIKPTQANADNLNWFVSEDEQSFTTENGRLFAWIRSYNLGGRSILWGRKVFRMGEADFSANKRDGFGVPWPIGYDDLAKWYDHVERFIGVSGNTDGIETLPDGVFQPAFELTCAERKIKSQLEELFPGRHLIMSRVANLTAPSEEQLASGRGRCQARNICRRGCIYGAYFSSINATLPAAERTGNLTKLTRAIVDSLVQDPETNKIAAVNVIDAETRERRQYTSRIVFLNASPVASAQILLNSVHGGAPNGVANQSNAVGRYLNDHFGGVYVTGVLDGLEETYYSGRRPTHFYIPRYRNFDEPGDGYLRGFGWQGSSGREGWREASASAGFGADLINQLRTPGAWRIQISMYGEALPRWENRMSLHPTKKDKWGVPLVHFDAAFGENEANMRAEAARDGVAMLEAVNCRDISVETRPEAPGYKIHEYGTIVMGADPGQSVLNAWNQAHDAPNLFVTDGACMPSAGCQNPSLTYMALTARAASRAVELFKQGEL